MHSLLQNWTEAPETSTERLPNALFRDSPPKSQYPGIFPDDLFGGSRTRKKHIFRLLRMIGWKTEVPHHTGCDKIVYRLSETRSMFECHSPTVQARPGQGHSGPLNAIWRLHLTASRTGGSVPGPCPFINRQSVIGNEEWALSPPLNLGPLLPIASGLAAIPVIGRDMRTTGLDHATVAWRKKEKGGESIPDIKFKTHTVLARRYDIGRKPQGQVRLLWIAIPAVSTGGVPVMRD